MGRIYSSAWGWSQYSTLSGQHTIWATPVNTSVWDSLTTAATIDTVGSQALALRIHAGGRLRIRPLTNLTCTGPTEINEPQGLRISSDATGTGSFIDNGTITYNTGGSAKVERYFPNDTYWHYYGLPVTSAIAQPFTGLFMRWFDETTYAFKEIIQVSTPLNPMWGYSVHANGSNATVAVTGSLNTGNLTTPTLTSTNVAGNYDGWNFAGNPYPSSINWLSAGLTKTGIDAYKYTWNGQQYLQYSAVDSTTNNNGNSVNRFINPEQGFFVHVTTNGGTGSLAFTNAARVHYTSVYNKTIATNTTPDKLILTATANGIDDEAHVVFSSDATAGFDPDYDALKLMGIQQAPNLYSTLPGDILASFNWLPWTGSNQVVPLGYSCGLSGVYRITASNMESFNPSTQIYLEDLKENFTQNLIANPAYDFNYVAGEDPNRFLLHFANSSTGITSRQGDELQIYSWEDIVYVKHLKPGDLRGTVSIYDLSGREVFSGVLENILLNKYLPGVTSGFYVVKVQTDRVFVTGKVFLNKQ